ncbi:hypothetical protein FALBO_10634 [Fusarium albosuccineum]|uniref:F-box domain-containing protein n=1 Tax=Fusarium albosuccineum TaxID=1237068 RepID=A0A8H4L6K8_9HYPO|nr:hypothetical protein FALBO_10634 [Fusarium albosuccineum]
MTAPGSSHIERLPTKVVESIALLLRPRDRAQLAAVSKAMRHHLKAIVFKNVCFIGNQDHLLKQLRAFILKMKALQAMKDSFVRSARIVLSADAPTLGIMTWVNGCNFIGHGKRVTTLPSTILKALETMDGLKSLSLDVYGLVKDEQKTMGELIPLGAKFTLKSLGVRASRDLTHVFLKHCEQRDLKTLYLYEGLRSSSFQLAVQRFPNLEGLRLVLDGATETEQPTRSTNPATINAVARAFPKLKSLVLTEVPTNHNSDSRLVGSEARKRFNKQFEDFMKSLGKFHNLRRVAFTMWRSRFAPGFLEPAAGHMLRRVPEWEWKLFFEGLINKVARMYPQLTEVCIFVEFPRLCRGIRMTDGRMVVDQVTMSQCDQPLAFPFWLVI